MTSKLFFSLFPEGPTAEVFELHLVADNTTVTQVKRPGDTSLLDKMLFLENDALADIFFRHDFITQVHGYIDRVSYFYLQTKYFLLLACKYGHFCPVKKTSSPHFSNCLFPS